MRNLKFIKAQMYLPAFLFVIHITPKQRINYNELCIYAVGDCNEHGFTDEFGEYLDAHPEYEKICLHEHLMTAPHEHDGCWDGRPYYDYPHPTYLNQGNGKYFETDNEKEVEIARKAEIESLVRQKAELSKMRFDDDQAKKSRCLKKTDEKLRRVREGGIPTGCAVNSSMAIAFFQRPPQEILNFIFEKIQIFCDEKNVELNHFELIDIGVTYETKKITKNQNNKKENR